MLALMSLGGVQMNSFDSFATEVEKYSLHSNRS